ncbi:MAG: hypothetical protein IH851_08560, partial [Armatimonadetes bacterium]|nr:hypothetical protein [Armatimonadota bacterium]
MVSITLPKDQVSVEPGHAATLTVLVTNRGEASDRFEIEVDGLDRDWLAIPVPTVTLSPGEERSQTVLIKPPRTAESKAGTYPFVVKVRSLESGEGTEAQAVLEVEPFHMLSLEVEPKRGGAGYVKKQAAFGVTAVNLGNSEENLQLFASDPEDACSYGFDHERVRLAPGQEKLLKMTVQPNQFPLVGSARLFGFSVSARSVSDPRTVASAQGQIDRRALFSPVGLLVALIITLVAGYFYLSRPMPPAVNYFVAEPDIVLEGEMVKLSWSFSNTKSVRIEADGKELVSDLPPEGARSFQVGGPTVFAAIALGDRSSYTVRKEVTVNVTPPLPLPTIEEFSITPRNVAMGAPLTVHYKARNAVELLLEPAGLVLSLSAERLIIPEDRRPEEPGVITYTLIAKNGDGKIVRSEPVSIVVTVQSTARIILFRAVYEGRPLDASEEVPLDARITIKWDLRNS